MAAIIDAYALSSTSIYVQWVGLGLFGQPYTVLWNGGAGPSNSGPIDAPAFLNMDYTITGLIPSTSYTIAVSNNIGTISETVNVTTLSGAPGTPTSLSAAPTGQSGQVSLNWNASNPGGPGTTYVIQSSTDQIQWNNVAQTTDVSIVVSGFSNGVLYFFDVYATNQFGNSGSSNIASATPYTIPGAPYLYAFGGNTLVTLQWTTPYNGGLTIIYYLVYVNGVSQTTGSTATSLILNGLNNGQQYSFQVAAVGTNNQSEFEGALSNVATATPSTVPGPPTITSAASNQDSQVTLIWTAPDDDGGLPINGYLFSGGPITTPIPLPSTQLSYTVTGLTNGTSYTFQVAATNANPNSPGAYAFASATPSTVPGAPTITSAASNQDSQVTLIWSAPGYDGGLPINGYLFSGGPITTPIPLPSTQLSYTVTGLTNGTSYTFQVAATNANPNSPGAYAFASATPSTVPDAPTNVSADTCDNQQATVTWTTPNDGGAAISSYNLQYSSPNAGGPWLPAPPFSVLAAQTNTYTFTGLTNGAQYFFRVAAVNSNGPGNYSDASNVSIPSITPNPPTSITAPTITSNSIALSWVAPSNTGGNPISEYQIYLYQTSPTGSIATIYAACVPPLITPTSNSIVNSASSPTIYNVSSPTSIPPTPTPTPSTITAPPTTYTIPNLASNTLYALQLSSANCSGIGPMSVPLIYVKTSGTPPSAPTNLIASGCNSGNANSVTLGWIAPGDGGSPITNYIVYYRIPQGVWITHTTNSATTAAVISFLETNTLYEFKVAAKNVAGLSAFSPVVTAIPCSPPTPPINLVATNPNDSIVLTWTPSQQSPPQTISYYFIEYNIETIARSVWTKYYQYVSPNANSLQLTNPPIANNVPYFFRVYAVNSSGGQSTPSNVVRAISYNYGTFVRPWSRAGGNNCPNCDSNYGYAACGNAAPPYSTYALDQRRKVEILKYKGNSAQLSQAQQYSMASRNALTRKKAWATQTQTYTNPNVNNLPETQNAGVTVALECNQPPVRCSLTSDSDVPGAVIPLCIDESVPLYNYKMQVTYSSGGKFNVF